MHGHVDVDWVSVHFLNFLHLSSHHSGPQLQSMIPPDVEVAKSERIVLSAALFGANNQGNSGN